MAPDRDPVPSGEARPVGTIGDSAPVASETPASPASDMAGFDDGKEMVGVGPEFLPVPTGWSDPATGTDGPRYWDRLISSEKARVGRYHRPATVAFVEFTGLERLSRDWGRDVAERALATAARVLGRSVRTSDHVARIEPNRFGLLLTETTEIEAINFIERARESCERELATAPMVGVAFGWASPPKKGDLSDAVALAMDRLRAELRALE